MPKTGIKGPVQLGWDDDRVVVTPEDQDRFIITAQKAVRACQQANVEAMMVDRFKDEFIGSIHRWCQRHADKVGECYAAVRDGTAAVFVIGSAPKYDFSLGDSLSALELELHHKGWATDVLQLPASDKATLRTFFDPVTAILIYADRDRTRDEGRA
jgi:hypothetical protein